MLMGSSKHTYKTHKCLEDFMVKPSQIPNLAKNTRITSTPSSIFLNEQGCVVLGKREVTF